MVRLDHIIGVRLFLSLLAVSSGCAGIRQTTIRVEGGYTLDVQPVTQTVHAGEVAVHEESVDDVEVDPSTSDDEPSARVYQLVDIEEVHHPGLPYLVAGGLLTVAAAVGGAWALRNYRTCSLEDCGFRGLGVGIVSFHVLPAASFMLIRGAELHYRSRNAFAGNSTPARVRRRRVLGGVTLIGVGAAVSTTLIVWGATRSPDEGAYSPQGQMDSAARVAYIGAATGAFMMAMGGIFLAQGLRLDDSATVALAPLHGGGIGSLQLSF